MTRLTRRTALLGGLATLGLAPCTVTAAPTPYLLRPDSAEIKFLFDFNGTTTTGTAPLRSADLQIDPRNLTRAKTNVTADLTRARTGFVFATEALKSASVLDTERFPTARFQSTKISLGRSGRISDGATLEGNLTLRDVTQAITLAAQLFRPRGSEADDFSRLQVRLRGQIDRHAFGISGYADLVRPTVGLDIRADIIAAG